MQTNLIQTRIARVAALVVLVLAVVSAILGSI